MKKKIKKTTLIKKQFITQYAEMYDLTYVKAKEIVESVINLMGENFKNGNSLIFRGFGSFEIKETKRKEGRNPRTGEIIKMKPKKFVKYKISNCIFRKES